MNTKCPSCNREWTYDNDSDTYVGLTERLVTRLDLDFQGCLHLCPCGGVVAITLSDGDSTLYTPSTSP